MTTMEALSRYRSEAFPEVVGWVAEHAVDALEIVASFHETVGVRGDALEIGVFNGRFFLALMATLRGDEVAVALDIFDDQSLNVDQSGYGSGIRAAFLGNIERFARSPSMARIIQADSMCTSPAAVLAQSQAGAFRLISVDGGHTAEHAMNDLWLASQVIAPGGVIFLDDFHSPHWPGVFEGFIRFMTGMNRNLAPVLYTGNKLLLTTISHQSAMVDLMRGSFHPGTGIMAEVRLAGFNYIASSY